MNLVKFVIGKIVKHVITNLQYLCITITLVTRKGNVQLIEATSSVYVYLIFLIFIRTKKKTQIAYILIVTGIDYYCSNIKSLFFVNPKIQSQTTGMPSR